MLPIEKGPTPRALSDAVRRIKNTPDATLCWTNVDGDERAAVLDALLAEQGELCAYCSRQIGRDTAHVEHFIPQSAAAGGDDPDSVSYGNLLAVCSGFEHDAAGLTCDRARKNALLTVNPLKPSTLETIRFRRDGTIYATDDAVCKDVETTLNLNQRLLKRNRRAALRKMWDGLRDIGERRGEGAVSAFCRRYVREHLDNPESRVAYDDALIYFMGRRAKADR